jgi:hypothetical protein
MKKTSAILLLSALPLACAAVPGDKPTDFTHSMPLGVSGKNAVVQLRLPKAVYLHSLSARLDDLRVFDASGASMPIALLQPPPQSSISRRDIKVKIFPVMGQAGKPGVDSDIDIRTAPDGSLTSVTTRTRPAGNAPAPLSALVLDLRDAGQAAVIDALKLTLPASTKNYTARVALAVSNDLKSWDTIGYSDLSWLVNNSTDSLANDRIEFEPRAFRYARLTWDDGVPLQFDSIIAESPTRTSLATPMEQLTLQPAPGRMPTDLLYQSALAIPVEKIGVQFADQTIVMPTILGQYEERPAPTGVQKTVWTFAPAMRATFFQIMQGGQRRASGDISVDRMHTTHWVLRSPAADSVKPQLRLSWTPATLVLLASGKGPYSLAFGSEQAESVQRDVAQVAPGFSESELLRVENATPGALQVGNVVKQAETPSDAFMASSSARTRMLTLWGALLLGVGMLGFMAWRLVKQMREEQA